MLISRRVFRFLLISLILLLSAAAQARTNDPSPNLSPFVKYTRSPGQLETAVVTYQNGRGQMVDLVSAVHIGSKYYYRNLNKRFKAYDAVLYELILPDEMAGQKLPQNMGAGGSGLSGMQGMMAKSMGLETQVGAIDYSAANFVHADLTTSGLQQRMSARQENLLTYLMSSLAQSGSMDEKSLGLTEKEFAQLDLMAVLSGQGTAKDRKLMRKLMAATIASSGGLMSAMNDTAIIAERNKQAMEVLKRETAAGKRSLAIYYGAAHMPDMEKRLKKAGWRKVKTDWVKAWAI